MSTVIAVTKLSRPAERVDLLQCIEDCRDYLATHIGADNHAVRKLWYACEQILRSEPRPDELPNIPPTPAQVRDYRLGGD